MLGASGVTQRSVLTRFQKQKIEKNSQKSWEKRGNWPEKHTPPNKRDLAISTQNPFSYWGGGTVNVTILRVAKNENWAVNVQMAKMRMHLGK